MFGALLGTLNSFQKQSSGKIARQTEKRAEIEARVKEQLAREKEELDEKREAAERERKERLEQAKLQIVNERVSSLFVPLRPRETMLTMSKTRLQRSLLLKRAHHLSTKTSPSIYFRPYLLTSDQKALIEEQISQAQAQIDADEHGTTFRPHRESSTQPRDEEPADEDDVERDPEDTNGGDYQQEDRGSPQQLENTVNDDEEAVVLED
jgi:pinin/SDK/memA/ protein conserved region